MPEENFRLPAPPAGDEILDRALTQIDRIQIHEAVDEGRPYALLEGLGQRRIAPQGGDLHAVEATGPLIRAQGIRAADLEPVAIEVRGERHARRAARAVLPERAACKFARQNNRKSTRLNSSHLVISYAVFCLKQKIIVADT